MEPQAPHLVYMQGIIASIRGRSREDALARWLMVLAARLSQRILVYARENMLPAAKKIGEFNFSDALGQDQ